MAVEGGVKGHRGGADHHNTGAHVLISTSIQGHVTGHSATQPNKAGETKLSTTTARQQQTGFKAGEPRLSTTSTGKQQTRYMETERRTPHHKEAFETECTSLDGTYLVYGSCKAQSL
jgi:hypothetical protein